MTGLTGRTVIVTGGGQGIGAAISLMLAAQGARVSVCDLHPPDATVSAIRAGGGEALGHVCDVADAEQVALAVADTLRAFDTIDGLVNNAALFATLRPRRLEEWSSEEFDQVLRTNVRGTFELIKAVLPAMRRQGYGKIVNVSSGTVFKGTPLMLPYVSSKGAVIALTRSVAREAGPDGIRVNCIAPGFTISEGVEANSGNHEDSKRRSVAGRCIARDQLPEDLTGVVRFLLSPESDFMTGQTVIVDGGSSMN